MCFLSEMKWEHGFPKTLILLQLLFLFIIFSPVSGKVYSEKSILLEFKNSVSDPSGILSSWKSDSDYCSWFGVTCNSESRVLQLNVNGGGGGGRGNFRASSCSKFPQYSFYGLEIRKRCSDSSRKLFGRFSPLIGKLTELRVLSLPFNELSGLIPVDIWGLEKLEVLDLEGNLFTGELPCEFDGLRTLQVLNLGFNRLSGEIPVSLSKCVALRVLNLAGNQLNGTIPGFIGSYLQLKRLYLSFNQLTGLVPDVFGINCWNLELVDLSGNFLNGRIPSGLGNCRQLQMILLFSNLLDGVIPRELGWLRNLEVLDVSRNSLSGPIPAELGGCVRLSVLVLSNVINPMTTGWNLSGVSLIGLPSFSMEHNYFDGSIPIEITTLPFLRILWAPKANLRGKFPGNWGGCDSLEMVNLAQNLFTGEINGVFGGCKSLHFLNLSSNRLTGKLDEKLPVPCMIVFDVSRNLMLGSIPRFNHSICPRLPSLNSDNVEAYNPSLAYLSLYMHAARLGTLFPFSSAILDVIHNFSENNFTGQIPWPPIARRRLGKWINYAFLAAGNKLAGSFPGHLFGKCDELNGMIVNVSNNKISGQFPPEVGQMCRNLKILDASKNEISGSVPQSIGDMGSLVALDLSGNKLQGEIPVSLNQLKYLKYLSLARNNLTGIIPPGLGGLRALEVLELSSNSLSGELPQALVSLHRLAVLLVDNNKLSGQIPSGLAHVRSLSIFNASFNNFSRMPLWKRKLTNCSSIIEHSSVRSCQYVSLFVSSLHLQAGHSDSKNYSASPSNVSRGGSSGFSSIEIASIISATAIVSVLLALVALFFYTRKKKPNSRVQGLESKEITVFVDSGIPLTFDNIVQATGNFSAGNCIGHGGFGATYKAEISPGLLVAVKRLSVGRFVQGVQQFHAEVKTLGSIRHHNLVTLMGYHASNTEMFLIYNYLPGGNLEKFIQERSARAVDWKILHKIALHIARALAYLHDRCVPRVLHRDVKPSNILLDKDFNAYLSDFGLSRLLGTSETHATTGVAGTFGYVAPEYAMTCRVSEKADVYSYGVVLLELISDKKALDPSFSSHGNGFNIVSWACMLLREGQANEVFNAGLWDSGPHDKLVETLHLAVMCTVDSLSIRPTMRQVAHRLKQLESPSS